MAHLAGTVIPLPTPFDESGEVDEKTFRQVIDFELDAKVDGLMVAGSYGQGPVIVHVGAPYIQSVILLAEHSAKIGAAALLIVPPYYYTDHSEFELIEHYRAVARAVSLPIYIYNNKRYAGIDITPEFARRLAEEVPTIRGIKLAWGTLEESVKYLSALKGCD